LKLAHFLQWQSPGQRDRRTAADRPPRQRAQLAAGHHGRHRAAAEDAQRQRRLDSARSAGGGQQCARADISGARTRRTGGMDGGLDGGMDGAMDLWNF